MKVEIKDLVVDQAIDIRSSLDEETIERYAESFEGMPPVVVFDMGEGLLLADGFHRIAAAERLSRSEIDAEIKKGTREDALEYAAIANTRHGRPLSKDEQREAVRRLSALHRDWDRQHVAETIGVSEDFVRRTLQADEVKRHTSRVSVDLGDAHYQEIATAPRENWGDLVERAAERSWSVLETRAAVQTLRSEKIPVEYKEKVLRGEAEPVRIRGGEPEISADTIRRRIEEAAAEDALGPLYGLLHQAAVWEAKWSEEMFGELRRDRVEQLARDLDRLVSRLQRAQELLARQLRRLERVS